MKNKLFFLGALLISGIVYSQVRITLSKSALATVSAGSSLPYTISLGNSGTTATANNATLTIKDVLPAGVTFVGTTANFNTGVSSANCTTVGQTLTCTIQVSPGLAAGAPNGTASFQIYTTAPASGSITNYASTDVSGGTNPPTPGVGCTPASSCGSATSTVQPQPSFGACDSRIFLSLGTSGQPTQLYQVDTSNNPFTYIPIGPAWSTLDAFRNTAGYNGIAYNPADNYIYGLVWPNVGQLVRIGADGSGVVLGTIAGLPTGGSTNYNNGEISPAGDYYTLDSGSVTNMLYRINLTTRVATPITLSRTVSSVNDLAWIGGKLYGVDTSSIVNSGTGTLISIDPVTGLVTTIGTGALGAMAALWGTSRALYASPAGSAIYQIDLTSGTRTLISSAPSGSNADGAHCVNAAINFSTDLSVTKTNTPASGANDQSNDAYIPGEIRTYTVVVSNSATGFGAQNITVSDPVPAGINASTVSWKCTPTSGGAVCGAATGTGALNDTGLDLPPGAVATYEITMTVPTTFTGALTNTVTITPPSNINDTNPTNNTATDVDTIVADCNSLYLIIDQKNAIYDITSLNGTLPSPALSVNANANDNLAVGKDPNNLSQTVFFHNGVQNNSEMYINNSNTNVAIGNSNYANGITASPVNGYVYANSATTGPGTGNRDMLRIYPNPANLGIITGDAFFNDTVNTNLATDSFFDTDGKYYIIAYSNAAGSTDKRLYSVNLTTLKATFVVSITGSPVNSRGLQGLAYSNGKIYMAINEAYNSNNQFKSIDIYEINPYTGVSTLKTTYSGIQANFFGGNYQPLNIDLGSCSTFISYCTKPGDFSTGGIPTKVGITNQTKLSGWPQSVPNGHITLESKDKGFVITRVNNAADITDPKEGMMVYDITSKCVKLYNGTGWKCIQRSCND